MIPLCLEARIENSVTLSPMSIPFGGDKFDTRKHKHIHTHINTLTCLLYISLRRSLRSRAQRDTSFFASLPSLASRHTHSRHTDSTDNNGSSSSSSMMVVVVVMMMMMTQRNKTTEHHHYQKMTKMMAVSSTMPHCTSPSWCPHTTKRFVSHLIRLD